MADISDVANGMVATVAGILFPGVAYVPGAWGTTGGVQVKAYRGWPTSERLDEDLAAGKAHVSVFLDGGVSRDMTRYLPSTKVTGTRAATITATLSGQAITFGGTITAGDVIGITAGTRVAGTYYGYRVEAGNTLASIAAQFAAAIPGASSAGAVLTLIQQSITARVAAPITFSTEVRRQAQGVRVTVWAPTPAIRDTLGATVDSGLAGLRDANGNLTRAIAVGTDAGMLSYRSSVDTDMTARDRVWRRDLNYSVEYATSIAESAVPLIGIGGAMAVNGAVLEPIGGVWRVAEVLTTLDEDSVWMDQSGEHLIGVQAP